MKSLNPVFALYQPNSPHPQNSSPTSLFYDSPISEEESDSGSQESLESNESKALVSKTPTYEYYGFVLYLLSFIVFGAYLGWAYLPDSVLHQFGS